jgi:hypothetical protein
MKPNKHVTILKTPQGRDYFTRHGLHLNGQGKEIIGSQLASSIGELFQHIEVLPITLGCVDNQADELEMKTSIICNDFNNVLLNEVIDDSKKGKVNNACRTSNRQKKYL